MNAEKFIEQLRGDGGWGRRGIRLQYYLSLLHALGLGTHFYGPQPFFGKQFFHDNFNFGCCCCCFCWLWNNFHSISIPLDDDKTTTKAAEPTTMTKKADERDCGLNPLAVSFYRATQRTFVTLHDENFEKYNGRSRNCRSSRKEKLFNIDFDTFFIAVWALKITVVLISNRRQRPLVRVFQKNSSRGVNFKSSKN
jgi:hypothetical protein